jgi:signal transduction histidine kinase/CheY-like chemotaxis protein
MKPPDVTSSEVEPAIGPFRFGQCAWRLLGLAVLGLAGARLFVPVMDAFGVTLPPLAAQVVEFVVTVALLFAAANFACAEPIRQEQRNAETRLLGCRREVLALRNQRQEIEQRLATVDAELVTARKTLEEENSRRQKADAELQRLSDSLEQRVQERTAESQALIKDLRQELEQRQKTIDSLRQLSERHHASDAAIARPAPREPKPLVPAAPSLGQEARLQHARALASGLAQELNTLLAPISLSAEMLAAKLHDQDERELLGAISTSVERGVELLRQVLVFARGIDGQRVAVPPGPLLQNLVEITRDVFPRHIRISTEIAEGVWNVQGDPTQLQQVLMKLSVNARDAMPSGGTLRLTAANTGPDRLSSAPAGPGGFVMLGVEDTGMGIAPSIQERLFEPFASSKEAGRGLGLGLSTVLGIVKSPGGTVEVQTGPRSGTKFQIRFPAALSQPTDAPTSAPVEKGPGRGETILVVESEPNLCQLTRRTLQAAGYEVLAATTQAEGIGLLAQNPRRIQLLLATIPEPTIEASMLTLAARKMEPELRIIAATAAGRGPRADQEPAALHHLGICHILAKPYTAQELIQAVAAALRTQQVTAPQP